MESSSVTAHAIRALCRTIRVAPRSHTIHRLNLSSRGAFASPAHVRDFHNSAPVAALKTKSADRGPQSKEDTQTDFTDMNVLRDIPSPSTAIDACTQDGFHLSSGMKVLNSGVLLLSGQAFDWKPWVREGHEGESVKGNTDGAVYGSGRLLNQKGQWDVSDDAWGVLDLVWPKPDLLIIGTGPSIFPLSPATRKRINDLGIRIEVQDTRNAASQYNLLATERGLQQVAAALIPVGWKEGR